MASSNVPQIYIPLVAESDTDFIGFSINGINFLKEYGIYRTSDGSRYNENLLPSTQDKTIQIPGGDGTYYFGTYFTQRDFSIAIAFDSLTEKNLSKLKHLLNSREMMSLSFDEAPYKVWKVKVGNSCSLKYLCFTSPTDANLRIYKGEGTLNFTAFDPFAHTPNDIKYLNKINTNTKAQWSAAAGFLAGQGTGYNIYDSYIEPSSTSTIKRFKLYNPGDLDTDFILTLKPSNSIKGIKLSLKNGDNDELSSLALEGLSLSGFGSSSNKKIIFNTKTHLIEGTDSNGDKDGTLYNRYIVGGDFFKIPTKETLNKNNSNNSYVNSYLYIYIKTSNNGSWETLTGSGYFSPKPSIIYDYLYF